MTLKSLKKNWLVISNVTWGIWSVLTRSTTGKFKNFTSMGYICPKCMKFELKTKCGSYLSWHWTVMQNLNKPWPCGFKNGIMNWVNFHYSTQKSEELCIDGLFLSEAYTVMFQLENFWGIMCHDTKGWCKIQKKTDLWLEKWLQEFH